MTTNEAAPAIPARVQTGLDQFCGRLKDLFGQQLVSVILYGGVAKNAEYNPRNCTWLSGVSGVLRQSVTDAGPPPEGEQEGRIMAVLLPTGC